MIDIVERYKRVFIGYPPWRKGDVPKDKKINLKRIHKYIYDYSRDRDKIKNLNPKKWKKKITEYINLVNEVDKGSYVIVPRPELGICYVGEISSKFELKNNPKWAKEYIEQRKKTLNKQKEKESTIEQYNSNIGDIVQSWKVKKWEKIPYIRIPVSIRISLFARSTTGRIKSEGKDYKKLIRKIKKLKTSNIKTVRSTQEVIDRMQDMLTPSNFEHLVCELLQLENPTELWFPIGGTGDGGLDGIGSSGKEIASILQCKLTNNKDLNSVADDLIKKAGNIKKGQRKHPKIYLAILNRLPNEKKELDKGTVKILGPSDIAHMLIKHSNRCAFSQMLKIQKK